MTSKWILAGIQIPSSTLSGKGFRSSWEEPMQDLPSLSHFGLHGSQGGRIMAHSLHLQTAAPSSETVWCGQYGQLCPPRDTIASCTPVTVCSHDGRPPRYPGLINKDTRSVGEHSIYRVHQDPSGDLVCRFQYPCRREFTEHLSWKRTTRPQHVAHVSIVTCSSQLMVSGYIYVYLQYFTIRIP